MFDIGNIAEAGYGSRQGPLVFLNSCHIFLQFSAESFPERNVLSNPLFIVAGTFFKYLIVFLAKALVPLRNVVLERPIPAPDKIVIIPSKSFAPVKYFQDWIQRSRMSPNRQRSADTAPNPE